MEKMIITGASGFIGKSLTHYFRKEKAIWVDEVSLRGSWTLDKNADAIIHLAAKSADTYKTKDEKEYFEVNRDLTIKLFQEFLDSNINDFIYFSSAKVIADSSDDLLDEETALSPASVYGRSKKAAEDYLISQTLPKGKRLFIIRPCLVHGKGNQGNLIALYKLVKKGIPWFFADFKNKRSFLYIDNLVYCVDKLLENKNVNSGVYNIADDDFISINEVILLMGSISNKKIRLLKIPKSLISFLFKLGDVMHLPINSTILNKLTSSFFVSNSKIKEALNIDKLPFSVREGLLKTLKTIDKDK